MPPKIPLSSIDVQHPGIGTITYTRSARARRISIYIRPQKGVKVVLPLRAALHTAEQFVLEKENWILSKLEKWKKPAQQQLFTANLAHCTRQHSLTLIPATIAAVSLKVSKGVINVQYPAHTSVEDEQVQSAIRKGITEALRVEAKQYLPIRLQQLASQHGLQYQKVSIKNTRTRWGSCSTANNINLSLHLMRLPDELCDYVLLHELAHTLQKNHGPGFWNLLQKICPNALELDRTLKNYRSELF